MRDDFNEVSATALRRDAEGSTRLVAKGEGELGEQILTKAQEHNVPILQDMELSKQLSGIPLGEMIPENMFFAIASLLGCIVQAEEQLSRLDRNA